MKDFIQVGQPHSEVNIGNMSSIALILFGFLLLALVITIVKELKKKNQPMTDKRAVAVAFIGIFGGFMLIAGTIWMVHQYRTYSHITDYQGTFDVVQSEADKIDTTSGEKPTITLKDKHGNHQVFEVSDNQMFRKGDKAVVKVKSLGKDKQPSLDKKLGQKDEGRNGFEITSIKPVK